MNALFRKGLLLVLFGGLVLAGVSLCLMLTAQRVYAEGCTAADPVFIQPDMRDVQALQAARVLFNWLMARFYAFQVFEIPAGPTVPQPGR